MDIHLKIGDEDSGVLDVLEPYDKVYANVSSEIQILTPVENCEHCNAKKVESGTPEF